MENSYIIIAGGNGLIGKRLVAYLFEKGYHVGILSRNPQTENAFYWNPDKKEIDQNILPKITHLINLTGASIAGERWTEKRKKEIIDSRVNPTVFLHSLLPQLTKLKHYITASGVSCYGVSDIHKKYTEQDPFGNDFLSEVVEKWENASDLFAEQCLVSKVRISPVLDSKGGMIDAMKKPIGLGFGAILGSGNQWMPWIHQKDLSALFEFIIKHKLGGPFNAVADNETNRKFTQLLAQQMKRPLLLPALPEFAAKLIFGEMATLLIDGVQVSNAKIVNEGFEFQYTNLEEALKQVLM